MLMWFASGLQDAHNDPFWSLYVSIQSLGFRFYCAERQQDRKNEKKR